MTTPRLTKSVDGRMRMTLKVEHRLSPISFVEHVAAHIHSSYAEKMPRTRRELLEIVRTSLISNDVVLEHNDDEYFVALAIVAKAFPHFNLSDDDTTEKEALEIARAYAASQTGVVKP